MREPVFAGAMRRALVDAFAGTIPKRSTLQVRDFGTSRKTRV